MKSAAAGFVACATLVAASLLLAPRQTVRATSITAGAPAPGAAWNARAAAAYLDGRQAWWQQWPNAARDHDTACVSCHTALPYALARPALRRTLGEHDLAAPERPMIANIEKRVKIWTDDEQFYAGP